MDDEIQNLGNEETVSKEQYNEVVEKLANERQSTANLVSEIKELRDKKNLSDEEAETLRKKVLELEGSNNAPEDMSPKEVIKAAEEAARKIFEDKERDDAKANRRAAFENFIGQHKEFHPDNDVGGIKLAALERKIDMFNTSGLHSVRDFMSVLEDAYRLIAGTQTPIEESQNPNPDAPEGSGATPKTGDDNKVSAKEMKIIDRSFGGDKERYLKIKAKRPEYVASLLAYIVD